jgi:uncharacterized metal-binding protein
MPNVQTHDRITYGLVPVAFIAADWVWRDLGIAVLATIAMLFSGLMFGPDLDLNSRPYRRWGPLRFIWKPYQALLPHRSKYSHGPILGTVIRVVYFLAIILVLGATVLFLRHRYLNMVDTTWRTEFATLHEELFRFWTQTEKDYFWAAFGGLWLGALGHTTADIIWSGIKRRIR